MSSVTEQIKEKIDIIDLIGAYVPLRKTGRSFIGFCPFHDNKRTPAFHVYPDTQSFHCYGCKASGTVFDFVMQREGIEFRDALEQLARRAGIELRERTDEDEQIDQQRTRMLEVNAAAAAFFHHMLVRSAHGAEAREYVVSRAISDETVGVFQLGYAPNDWQALLNYLTNRRSFSADEIEAAGLAIRHETRGYYDRFRHRLIFPIRNTKGEVIAFGGRAFGDTQPKYLNSPQTLLFDKGKTLYGLDLARDAIRTTDAAVIVEGYVDVIMAHQGGFRNVVAPLGTALTPDHAALVKKLAHTIYLALDADAAGVRATLKGAQALQEGADGELIAIATPHGIAGWQRRHDIEIKILELPQGKDPDQVIQADPDLWRRLVAQALPAMEFYLRALTSDLDLQSGRGKAQAVERLAPLFAQIASPVEQAHYVQLLARTISVEEPVIMRAMQGGKPSAAPAVASGRRTAASRSAAPRSVTGNAQTQEDALLGLVLRYPAARTAVEEKLRSDLGPYALLQPLIEGTLNGLLTRPENRALWKAWLEQQPADIAAWIETCDEVLRDHGRDLLQRGPPQPQAYRYVNDALECATILQRHTARRWNRRLSEQLSTAEQETERAELLEQIIELRQYIDSLATPRRSSTYADLHTLHSV
ncbi:MAG TPA: DNA primase [Roseiflexaceae bacterium]|nr:DNA primase [Roseiflexaceae bacterium]HMP38804.1 DNA primase [Roseiflexaceae bacterium]